MAHDDEARHVVAAQNEQQDGHHLRRHLDLAQPGRRNRDPAGVGQAAQHGHGQLPSQDDGHHPGGRQVHLDERHQGGGDEQLVGQRVHQLAERGDLLPPPREVAVEPVGERRDGENGRADQFLADPEDQAPLELGEQHDHQQRDQEDPRDGQRVGQVQRQASDRV